jgi:hypothetical protein
VYVTLQLKLPAKMAADLQERLLALQTAHATEVTDLQKQVAAGNRRYASQLPRLVKQTKMITFHNLTRAALWAGMEDLKETKDGDLIDQMCAIGLSRGRPDGT